MAAGYSTVVVGVQYGDEGKARAVDGIAENYGVIARFNGGSNAGHTIQVGNRTVFMHQIPSGVFYPEKQLYIGSGCVVNPVKLDHEIKDIESNGLEIGDRLHISGLASLVQPHHIVIDNITGDYINTTKQGIGPAYADRALRMDENRLVNIRAADLLANFKGAVDIVKENLEATIKRTGAQGINVKERMDEFAEMANDIKRYIGQDTLFLVKQIENGQNVLFEGAQSVMLDPVQGPVPYVTSSSTVAAAAYVGGDLPHKYHRNTIGVAKAVMSRVGNGPFASEFGGRISEDYCADNKGAREAEAKLDVNALLASKDPFELSKALRVRGNEYGATTGRPRRIGALDLVQLRQVVRLNAIDTIYLNKTDCLSDYALTASGKIPVVTGYRLDGKEIDYIPAGVDTYRRVEAITEELPAFSENVTECRDKNDLPEALTHFVAFVENAIGCKVETIGVGPRREQCVSFKD